jgi:predicted secreted protein
MRMDDMKPVQFIVIAVAIALIVTVVPAAASGNFGVGVSPPANQWKNTTQLVLGLTNSTIAPVSISANQWKDIRSLVRDSSNTNEIVSVSIPTPTYREKDNGTVVSLARDSIVKIQLNANPSTGASWNVTTSPGIQVLSFSYLSSYPGRPGAPGTDTWVLKLNGTGTQQFSGVYKQQWMPASPDDSRYILPFNVTSAGTTGFE